MQQMLEQLIACIDEWQRLGVKSDASGSRLIAHTPRDYPDAYLHAVFSARSQADWNKYGISLPEELQQLYAECNGLMLFGTALSVFGVRSHHKRSADAAFQPFDLVDHDRELRAVTHRLSDSQQDDRVFFGGYDWDGSNVYIVPNDGRVFWCRDGSAQSELTWPSIAVFLQAEYDRILGLFDDVGYPKDDNVSTAPA